MTPDLESQPDRGRVRVAAVRIEVRGTDLTGIGYEIFDDTNGNLRRDDGERHYARGGAEVIHETRDRFSITTTSFAVLDEERPVIRLSCWCVDDDVPIRFVEPLDLAR